MVSRRPIDRRGYDKFGLLHGNAKERPSNLGA